MRKQHGENRTKGVRFELALPEDMFADLTRLAGETTLADFVRQCLRVQIKRKKARRRTL